jgi:hypothetical protein
MSDIIEIDTTMPFGLAVPLDIQTPGVPDTILPMDPDIGEFRIVGSVTEVINGVNTPRLARVFLIIQDRWETIRMTHSDPVTGAYEFTGLRGGVQARLCGWLDRHARADCRR